MCCHLSPFAALKRCDVLFDMHRTGGLTEQGEYGCGCIGLCADGGALA